MIFYGMELEPSPEFSNNVLPVYNYTFLSVLRFKNKLKRVKFLLNCTLQSKSFNPMTLNFIHSLLIIHIFNKLIRVLFSNIFSWPLSLRNMESEKKKQRSPWKVFFQGARVCEQKWVCERDHQVILENPSNEFLMDP